MLRRIRRWLNVRTWDQSHVPYEDEERDYGRLFDYAPNVPEEIKAEYFDLDEAIRLGEIDPISAMTEFWSGGKIDVQHIALTTDTYKVELTDDERYKVARIKLGLSEQQKGEKRRYSGYNAEYTFPPNLEEIQEVNGDRIKRIVPVHVPPRGALLMPVKLNSQEREVAKLVRTTKDFLAEPLKLKPAFKKKLRASEQPASRVYWDDKGKMQKVK